MLLGVAAADDDRLVDEAHDLSASGAVTADTESAAADGDLLECDVAERLGERPAMSHAGYQHRLLFGKAFVADAQQKLDFAERAAVAARPDQADNVENAAESEPDVGSAAGRRGREVHL